jgi:hypothetical protein
MIQRILRRFSDGEVNPSDEAVIDSMVEELSLKFEEDRIETECIREVVTTLYPQVPGDLPSVSSGISMITLLEESTEACGLDISKESIKLRNPPGNKMWKDPQRRLFDTTLCATFVLKAQFMKRGMKYTVLDDFIRAYPEFETRMEDISSSGQHGVKRKRELEKIASASDLSNEMFICNTMFLVIELLKRHNSNFKTWCIFLVADLVGDGRGHMGRDPSANTLRLLLYFDRLTETDPNPNKRRCKPGSPHSSASSYSNPLPEDEIETYFV